MALPMAMTALPSVTQSVVLSAVWSMVEFFRVGVEEPVELWFEDGERGDVVAESGLPDLWFGRRRVGRARWGSCWPALECGEQRVAEPGVEVESDGDGA